MSKRGLAMSDPTAIVGTPIAEAAAPNGSEPKSSEPKGSTDGSAPRRSAPRQNKRLQKLIGPNIREHLVDVAEALFAQRGVAETSVRAITSEAKVNVAAINYYFGSKEELYQAVIDRRLEPLIAERSRLLDICERDKTSGGPTVEQLLYALAAPSIRLHFVHPNFTWLASRLRLDSDEALWNDYRARQLFLRQRFADLFAVALPHLSRPEVEARLAHALGALLHIWSRVPVEESPEKIITQFLTFYAAAFRAPEPGEASSVIAGIISSGYGDDSPDPTCQEAVLDNN